MDMERQNYLKEVEAEIKKESTNATKTVVTSETINELFCEASKRFGSTLKKLAEN